MTVFELIEILSRSFYIEKQKAYTFGHIIFDRIVIDSRKVQKNDLFIAIQGKNHDGAHYINEAFANGAVFALLQNSIFYNGPSLSVSNTKEALSLISAFYRAQSSAKIIAVTGSVAKTTTKTFLNDVLSHFGNTISSPQSFNNDIGVPLSLLQLKSDTDFGIFEVGMNHTHEIEKLAKIINPHIALITSIGEAHIGNFSSLNDIAIEKAHIFDSFNSMKEKGVALIPADSHFTSFLIDSALRNSVSDIKTIGSTHKASTRLIECQENFIDNKSRIKVSVEGHLLEGEVPFIGHYLNSILFVLATLDVLSLIDYSCLENKKRIFDILSKLKPLAGRGSRHLISLSYKKKITLIDDSFNANPCSMKSSLDLFSKMNFVDKRRKVLILGCMLELGERSIFYHKNLKEDILKIKEPLLITVGEKMKALFDELSSAADFEKRHYDSAEDVLIDNFSFLQDKDVVLIKGSKGSYVSSIAKSLIQNFT
jgi:UDP-N-acetylmuramoyl-tripeptide--D-alanyl-D-alanine ligase